MDREDARFVANALVSRITGARVELEQLAASSLMRLSAISTTINRRNPFPNRWPPAIAAADELMEICRQGGALADIPLDGAKRAELEEFVATMDRLAGEPPMRLATKAERRALRGQAKRKLLHRQQRIVGVKPLELIK